MTTETSIYEYAKQGLALSPDKTAIWFYGKSITYWELFEKIDNVADHLYALGVREGTVVTIHLPNCPQAVMAIYAVAKLGGICNMVHPLMPEAALWENMAFTESKLLLTHLSLSEENTIRRIVRIEEFHRLEEECKVRGVYPIQTGLAATCVLYLHSSGTTGKPKTVMHSHAAMNRIVANTFSFLHCKDFTDQVVLAELPLFHGFGLIDNLHDAIAGGGQLVQMTRWDSHQAANWIDQYQVTFFAGVPKHFYDLLEEDELSGNSLTHCYVGGDIVNPELKRRFNGRMKRDSLLYEGYGMAEVIAYCCSCGPFNERLTATGLAMPGVKTAIMINDCVSAEGTGELLIRSDSMMLGYYRSDDNCFIQWNEEEWLKTGDYVRLDSDGYMYFIERIKNVIVKNGYNIFPSELEARIRTVGGVSEVCVIGVNGENTQKVVAVLEADESQELIDDLYRLLNAEFPAYAVPSEVCFVKRIPRNQTGKVDRIAVRTEYEKKG